MDGLKCKLFTTKQKKTLIDSEITAQGKRILERIEEFIEEFRRMPNQIKVTNGDSLNRGDIIWLERGDKNEQAVYKRKE